jgi:hypothetical protein
LLGAWSASVSWFASREPGQAHASEQPLPDAKGWRLDRWIRDLLATAPADGALADRIFLDTVLRPGPLDFALPRRLRRLLPRPFCHGRAGWTRRIPSLAAGR